MKNEQTPALTLPFADLHTHLLPGMDDGSDSVETSLAMLSVMEAYGLAAVAATPHFDPRKESPTEFLGRREAAQKKLLSRYSPASRIPICFGAEVMYFEGIGQCKEITRLCMGKSSFILIEMPYRKFSQRMIDDLISVRDRLGLIPIIAHIERSMRHQKLDTLDLLVSSGMILQMNAEHLISSQRKAGKLIDTGLIGFLCTDAHNISTRKPNLDAGVALLDEETAENFSDLSMSLFSKMI